MIILILGKKVESSILEVKTSCFAVLGADESNLTCTEIVNETKVMEKSIYLVLPFFIVIV